MRGSLNSLNLRDAEVAGSNPAFPTRSAALFCCPQGRRTTHRPQMSWSLIGTHGLRRSATCHGRRRIAPKERHRVRSEIQVGTRLFAPPQQQELLLLELRQPPRQDQARSQRSSAKARPEPTCWFAAVARIAHWRG